MSLTRSGYLTGETPEIKKELTVRAVVNTEFGIFRRLPLRYSEKQKQVYVFPDFTVKKSLVKQKKIVVLSQLKYLVNLMENSVMKHIKMMLWQQQLNLGTAFSHFLVALGKRQYPWP
jgi:hypothetical protein